MMISSTALSVIVVVATLVATLTPILLLALFIRDWKKGCLW
ncbi:MULTISPECIES: hypothetical protein [unclassified Thioalkalivibrio]|jgi:hypothetical protein|nr:MULTISPECIES: hypothetical protein [unclassified Thioalkalivibrio]ADC70547.1 conserved hypothetical protein [Thioalkalivibrio sp. K90mix]